MSGDDRGPQQPQLPTVEAPRGSRIRGSFLAVMFALNTLFWAVPVYLCILLKVLVPTHGRLFQRFSRWVADLAQLWASCNTWFVDRFLPIRWDIQIDSEVRRDGQYLVCANHQSWNDIVVLMKAFGRDTPFFKFFLKQELIWVPVLGPVWWGLDYPFMKRYSNEQIKRNPKLKGTDLETTRRACERAKHQPMLLLNFLEGTRFTKAKHDRQASPYQHLLKPKSGGFAFATSALGERLNSLLDVTIVYPEGAKGLWDFLCGRVGSIIVRARKLQVPHRLYTGDYDSDHEFRKNFQKWVSTIWREKDEQISRLLAEAAAGPAPTR